jgi:hypothetical protein
MAPRVIYHGDKSEADRIRDRLKPSSGPTWPEWPSDTTVTVPNRTVTSIYHGASQSGPTIKDQPVGSRPQDVGVGIFDSNEERFQRMYGLNNKRK